MKTIILLAFVVFSMACIEAKAQDTESKDDPSYIIVYIRLQVEGSACRSCYDSLTAKIRRIPGANNVRCDIQHSLLKFQMHSSMLVNEQQLRNLAEESNLMPMQVVYEKEMPDEEEEPITF